MNMIGLLIKRKLTTIFLTFFIVLTSGCASHHWVSDAYPDGNNDLGRSLYRECLKKVPKSVRDAAVPGYSTTPVYVSGAYGGVISMGSRSCYGECRNAQKIENRITDKCMKEHGNWRFIKKN